MKAKSKTIYHYDKSPFSLFWAVGGGRPTPPEPRPSIYATQCTISHSCLLTFRI